MLTQIGQHQVRRHRRSQVEPGLAPLTLDVVFAGKCKTAKGLHACLSRMPTGLGAKQFRHIGLGTTRDTSLEERRRPERRVVSSRRKHLSARLRRRRKTRQPGTPVLVTIRRVVVVAEQAAPVYRTGVARCRRRKDVGASLRHCCQSTQWIRGK